MRILVTAASRHGSTREIGEWIVNQLRSQGLESVYADPSSVSNIEEYDAVVIGSAIYVGQWLSESKDFVDRFTSELQSKSVWLFSSGLSDVPAKDANGTPSLRARMETTGAAAHRHFPGKLDVLELSLAERAAIMAARGKYGDSRDQETVQAWANEIAHALTHVSA